MPLTGAVGRISLWCGCAAKPVRSRRNGNAIAPQRQYGYGAKANEGNWHDDFVLGRQMGVIFPVMHKTKRKLHFARVRMAVLPFTH